MDQKGGREEAEAVPVEAASHSTTSSLARTGRHRHTSGHRAAREEESTRGKRGEAEEPGRKAAGWGLQEESTLGRGPWGSAVTSDFSPHTSGRSSEGLGGAPGGCRVEGRQERGSKRQ